MAAAKILAQNIVGPQIRQLRSQQRLTQQAFAERCQLLGWDISRDTLAEGRESDALADFEVVFLADALRVPLDLLLPERGEIARATVREFVARLSGGKPSE